MTKTENLSLPQLQFSDTLYGTIPAGMNAPPAALKAAAGDDLAEQGATLTALTAGLGTTGHNCRVVWGSYTGTGAASAANPVTLSFDFIPLLVMVYGPRTSSAGSSPTFFLRDQEFATIIDSGYKLTVTWGERSLQWWNSETDTSHQINASGWVYHYLALGYDA